MGAEFNGTIWKWSTRLVVPPNITIVALPPKSPELNPVENVWQYMLRSMEQARRSTMAHHVHRIAPMGARVLINGTWY
jgi:hypothetical protein